MKKRMCVLFILSLAVCMMGCAKTELSEEFEKEEVIEEAKAIIQMINEGETETVWEEKFNAKMQSALTKEDWLAAIDPIMEDAGEFQNYEKEAVTGTEELDTGEEFATVVVVAEYENGKNQYTITLNKSMQLTGFFVK